MMIVLDVNVLLAVARDDHPDHETTTRWMTEALTAGETFTAPDAVWVGVIRLLTHPKVFSVPSALVEALTFQREFLSQDWYQACVGLPHGWAVFADTVLDGQARGNLVTDAYIASVARALGSPVATEDRGFRRFAGVEVIHPSAC